ncbi:GAF domain-containing protein [Cyanobacteria bacterium FACHB-471]|nr:GAF domain-containing protein [Cyanobacteria bacterium FACHB-471]
MVELNSASSNELSKYTDQFTRILQQVCQTTDWEYGEVWLPQLDSPILELSSAWYVSAQLDDDRQLAWKQFRYCSEKFVLRIGEGLPGRVWASQTTEWIMDVSAQSESYFLRHQIAKAFGAKASFGLPINTKDMHAVVAFFRSEAQNQNAQLMAATEAIVRQSHTQG